MEIAFLVIAVIGLLALTAGSSASAATTPMVQQGVTANPQPQTWTPQPAGNFGVPMVPSQSANIDGAIFSGAGQVGTQVASQAVKSTGLAGVGLSAATAGIAAGVGIIVGIATTLLAQHKARMTGAKNENAAVDQYVPVFDSFVKAIVQAYNSKQCTAQQAATACQQMDQYIYQTFRSFVGQPGTQWNDTSGMAGKCDKTCTVGCCVYFGDLGPVLNNISAVLGFQTSKWGKGDPRISGRTITVPKVYPSKYSSYSRELYTVTLN